MQKHRVYSVTYFSHCRQHIGDTLSRLQTNASLFRYIPVEVGV